MTRNVRTYAHFCLLARTLEQIGDRWTLLVVRDLLTGAKRYTDLMERLGGITPKTLSQRLRELTETGLIAADRQPGRREVWYRLTDTGLDLAPAVDALITWGLRHAWRLPEPGEPAHVEHLLRTIVTAIDRTAEDREPAQWLFDFAGDQYTVTSDGHRWSLTATGPHGKPDVTVTATVDAFKYFAIDPSAARASDLDVDIAGDAEAVTRFLRLAGTFADVWQRPVPSA